MRLLHLVGGDVDEAADGVLLRALEQRMRPKHIGLWIEPTVSGH